MQFLRTIGILPYGRSDVNSFLIYSKINRSSRLLHGDPIAHRSAFQIAAKSVTRPIRFVSRYGEQPHLSIAVSPACLVTQKLPLLDDGMPYGVRKDLRKQIHRRFGGRTAQKAFDLPAPIPCRFTRCSAPFGNEARGRRLFLYQIYTIVRFRQIGQDRLFPSVEACVCNRLQPCEGCRLPCGLSDRLLPFCLYQICTTIGRFLIAFTGKV